MASPEKRRMRENMKKETEGKERWGDSGAPEGGLDKIFHFPTLFFPEGGEGREGMEEEEEEEEEKEGRWKSLGGLGVWLQESRTASSFFLEGGSVKG
jgi:hypothetical protein